jgi:hypothetical protein
MAVGRAFRDVVGADHRPRARPRLDDDRLFPAFGERRHDDSRVRVAAPADRERDDEAHRLHGKRLGVRQVRCCKERGTDDGKQERGSHGVSPGLEPGLA